MSDPGARVAARWLGRQAKFDLKLEGLAGLTEGRPVTLYHGTTRTFTSFDLSKSRDDLVNQFYGRGIFLTPSKRVADRYAEANRNIGFEPSIIDDLRRRNPGAGQFLQALYSEGKAAWELLDELGLEAFEKALGGADGDTLDDIAEYIIGSKLKPGASNEPLNIFSTSTGAPDWLYNQLDEVGLDSTVYRPKIYTVVVTVSNTLVTANNAQAKKARQQGYEAVVFHGSRTIDDVPEVAVFDPRHVKIVKVEVV